MRFILFAILAAVMFTAAPASADGCVADPTIDLKVITYTWPAGVGIDAAVFDFRAALKAWGTSACFGGDVDVLGVLRFVPWIGGLLPAAGGAE